MRTLGLLLVLVASTASATAFRNPLNGAQCGWAGGCYVTAYFDLNRNGGAVRDWNCGTKTYDNHAGTDIGIGGFAGMNQGRDVHAAADGVVIGAHDGEFDQCTSGACGASNYVWLKHADGKVTLYYHLRKNTVAVSVGQQVTCGQKLGQVGSSGQSTGPHLHFQVNTVQGDPNSFDDPFAATNANCGGPISYWVAQGGYASLPGYTCEAKPMPDVSVTSISMSPASPVEGADVTFSAVVKNSGNAATGATVGVAFFVDGANVGFNTTGSLAAGASATLTSNATWKATKGTHSIEAFVDDVNRFAESNENNNKRSQPFAVTALPDFTIASVEVEPLELVEGDGVTFRAVIENQGGAAPKGFSVAFRIGGSEVASAAIGALAAGGSETVTASWTAIKGTHFLQVAADPGAAVAESNNANNTLAKTFLVRARDADGDGARADVDCNDGDSAVHEGAPESCNGVDDDCDGEVDEGLSCDASPASPSETTGGASAGTGTGADGSSEPPELAEAKGGCSATASMPLALLALLLSAAPRKRNSCETPGRRYSRGR